MKKMLNPSMAVALLALFVALSGTSYAVTRLPRNSVGSQQIRNNAVTNPKIASGAVSSDKVQDGSLMASDFASGQLPQGARGEQGAQGEPGPPGAKGETGERGPVGPAGAVITSWGKNPTFDTAVADSSNFVPVMSTTQGSPSGNSGGGNITLSVRSRVTAQASYTMQKDFTDSAKDASVLCYIILYDATDNTALSSGNATSIMLHSNSSNQLDSVPGSNLGVFDLNPGSYKFTLSCRRGTGAGMPRFFSGAMSVAASPL